MRPAEQQALTQSDIMFMMHHMSAQADNFYPLDAAGMAYDISDNDSDGINSKVIFIMWCFDILNYL